MLLLPILALVVFVLIPNPIMAQVQNNPSTFIPYVVAHWGLQACSDLGNVIPLSYICQREDVIIQQNDIVIKQNQQILSNMTYQENLQVYQLCISSMSPNAGSLPGSYLLSHGISCTLPKANFSYHGTN